MLKEVKMELIPSFKKNHDKLQPGLYESGINKGVTTWDLRFKKPNCGDFLSQKSLHTIEHALATAYRNSEYKDDVIYFGPMGCRTGFYLLTTSLNYEQVVSLTFKAIEAVLNFTEVPGAKRTECGNYLEHDLNEAKADLKEYLALLQTGE